MKFLYLMIWMLWTPLLNASDVVVKQVADTKFSFNVKSSQIDIEIAQSLIPHEKILLSWLVNSAHTVTDYYDQFPVNSLFISIEETDGNKVTFGQAFGGEEPFIRVVVGRDITVENLSKDWVLVHELVHLAMAYVHRRHLWLLEGLSTYVESIARAQQGELSEEFVWKGFIKNMPKGLPKANDKGLDYTPTWGRKYWGGAIFCLLADVEIRKQTNNRFSLQDALKGVLKEGYSMHKSSTPDVIFKAGDKAVGVSVLMPLYSKMKASSYPVDLNVLWKSLGVKLESNRIIYNDNAPLSAIRKNMLKIISE